jgi:hypothetical protein
MELPPTLYHYTSQKGLLGIPDIGSDEPKPPVQWIQQTSCLFRYTIQVLVII